MLIHQHTLCYSLYINCLIYLKQKSKNFVILNNFRFCYVSFKYHVYFDLDNLKKEIKENRKLTNLKVFSLLWEEEEALKK